ncbi:glutamate receptor ionotropic, delta-2-like [Panulirus ornatus]|uniref:glutamate receptor ionotropic, delta-2-like n=1 Tax=Panulirus ornatus TaxID=150431 RepID=UPI003A86EDFA
MAAVCLGRYHLALSPDGNWGGPQPDNTITGLVGQVARHEAHAALCALTITDTRETVVDFTAPYYFESATFVSPAPKEKNRSFAILSPFTLEVWLCIIVATVLAGPLLSLVSRLLVVCTGEADWTQYSLQTLSFNMYRSLVFQESLIITNHWSLRFICFGWFLFTFCIYAMYSGTLTAALAIRAYEKPIDSLYDLAQAHRDGYTIATTRDSNYDAAFKNAESGIYKEVWQLFDKKDPQRSLLPNPDVGIDMVLKEKYVFINSLLSTKLKAAQRGREKFYLARQTFLPQGYGIICNNGSPIKDVFSRILIRLTEVGLVIKWTNDEVNKVYHFMSSARDPGPTAISLQHLQAAFFIMVLGLTISAIVLVLEIVASFWKRSRSAGKTV